MHFDMRNFLFLHSEILRGPVVCVIKHNTKLAGEESSLRQWKDANGCNNI